MVGCCSKLMMSLGRGSHIYYRVKMEEREILGLGKVRCSQESPAAV